MLLVAFFAAVQTQTVTVVEPRPASPWTETFKASCRGSVLEVSQPIYPLGGRPRIHLNGKPIQGEKQLLEKELDEPGAAYRMSLQCSPTSGAMSFRWVRGLSDGKGRVRYRTGAAGIKQGVLVDVRSEEATAEDFWYR